MGTFLTLAVSAYFFVNFYRLQFVYLLFIFLIPFLPKYIGFGMGNEGFALSLIRILILILFISTFVSFTQNSTFILKRLSQVYQHNQILINLLLLFFILKIFSLSLNSEEFSLYIMLFFDFLFTVFIFILTILVINSEEAVNRIMNAFFYGYSIVLILVLIESFMQFPILSVFASSHMELEDEVLEGFIRSGRYRANGSFINPILLSEYLVIFFPIIVSYLIKHKYSLILKLIYFLLFTYAIYSTGSRSGFLMFFVAIYLYIIINFYRSGSNTNIRLLANIINLIIIGIVLYFVYNYINELLMNFHGRFDKLGGEETASSTSRALQYVAIYDKIQEALYFGFGRDRNFVTKFDFFAIDNYYFWVVLEVGIIGVSVYILFLYTLIKKGLFLYRSVNNNYYLLSLLISVILSILYQILVSAPDNLIYLYIFAGILSGMKILQNNKKG